MNIITLDFETYYSKSFSLSKITTEEYIRSPEFEVIGVSVNDELAGKVLQSGASMFLRKPVEMATFLRAIRVACAGTAQRTA